MIDEISEEIRVTIVIIVIITTTTSSWHRVAIVVRVGEGSQKVKIDFGACSRVRVIIVGRILIWVEISVFVMMSIVR